MVLELLADSGVVLDILLLLSLVPLLVEFGLEVVVVRGEVLGKWFAKHDRSVVFYFLGSEQFHGVVIVLLILVEMILTQHEYLGVSPQVLSLVLVSPFGCLHAQNLPFLGSVLLSLARHHPLLDLFVSLPFHLLLPLLSGVDEGQCVLDQAFLNVSVERSVCRETGGIVYFQKAGIQLVVDHDIEAKNFEAHVVAEALGVYIGDGGTKGGITSNDGLDEQIVDLLLQLLDIVAVLSELGVDRGEGPLVADVHVLDVLVEDEVGTVLVDGVVGEVHELVV